MSVSVYACPDLVPDVVHSFDIFDIQFSLKFKIKRTEEGLNKSEINIQTQLYFDEFLQPREVKKNII